MLRKLSLSAAAIVLGTLAAHAATVQLQPIPDAFARLGHSCGGIKLTGLPEWYAPATLGSGLGTCVASSMTTPA